MVCLLPVLIRFLCHKLRRKTTGSVTALDMILLYTTWTLKLTARTWKWWVFKFGISFFKRGSFPIGSMYGIFTYISHENQPNVGKYTIHGSYGFSNSMVVFGVVHHSGPPKKMTRDSPAQGVVWNEHISNECLYAFLLNLAKRLVFTKTTWSWKLIFTTNGDSLCPFWGDGVNVTPSKVVLLGKSPHTMGSFDRFRSPRLPPVCWKSLPRGTGLFLLLRRGLPESGANPGSGYAGETQWWGWFSVGRNYREKPTARSLQIDG